MSSASFPHSMNMKSPAAIGYCFSMRDSSTDGAVMPFNASAVTLIISIRSLKRPDVGNMKIVQSFSLFGSGFLRLNGYRLLVAFGPVHVRATPIDWQNE